MLVTGDIRHTGQDNFTHVERIENAFKFGKPKPQHHENTMLDLTNKLLATKDVLGTGAYFIHVSENQGMLGISRIILELNAR